MFVTVFGQKGGVAKTCTSVHLAAIWSNQYQSVVLVDADRNRSASAYGARGLLNFEVAPIEAAAKATRYAEVVVTDGQASSSQEEIKNLVDNLKKDNQYLKSATDLALMYPMLEMANNRFKCIENVLYKYNRFHPESNNISKQKLKLQKENAKYFKSLMKYERKDNF